MTKVFISYSRKDKVLAEKLHSALKNINLDSWIDWIDIPPTADWWDQIQKGIESADAFLVLLSPDSIISKVCKEEIDHAIKNGKRLIPLVIRDVRAEDVHEALTKLNWIFFRELDDFETSLRKLEAGIKTDLSWVESHRRLQVKAIEWDERKDRSLLLRGKDLQEVEEQLANASQKDPPPTDLQRQYVLESRRRESQTRNTLMSVGSIILVMLVFLSIFAFNQQNLANDNAQTAVANQNAAETAQLDAINQKGTAIANEQTAVEQATIALARQLAAQAQFLFATDLESQEVAIPLAIRSMQLFPTRDAADILQNTTLTPSLARMSHDGPVTSVAFSPDGQYVLSDSQDGPARVWEAASGEEVTKISHDAEMLSVVFSPDGKYVILSSKKGFIRVYDTVTGNEVAYMTHDGAITSVAFSLDGLYIVSGSEDGTARIWEIATWNEIARMVHDGVVTSVAFSPATNYVLTGSEDNTARVWEAATGNEITRMDHDNDVLSIAFSSDGNLAASGDQSGVIRVWETTTGNEISHWTDSVTFLEFSPDDRYVLSGGGLSATVWESATGNMIASMFHNDYAVISAGFSPDGRYVLSSSEDGTARLWEAETGSDNNVIAFLFDDGSVNSVAFSPDSRYLVFGSCAELARENSTCSKGSVRVLETATGREVARMLHQADVPAVAFSPDGRKVVSGSVDGSVQIWNADSNKEIARLVYEYVYGYVESVEFSPDGKYVIPNDGITRAWDYLTGKEISIVKTDEAIFSLKFSPDGKYIISGNEDGLLRMWETSSGNEVATMTHDDRVTSIAYSTDGKYVVTGSKDNTARVWEAATGNEIASMTHDGPVVSVAISPDGKYVVSGSSLGSSEGTARVWETTTGNEIAHRKQDVSISFVAFNADGTIVISSSIEDKSAYIWEATTGDEVARITHNDLISTIALSPDGKTVASAACEKRDPETLIICRASTILVWDAATGAIIARMNHDDWIWDLAFSPDGRYLAAGAGASINISNGDGDVLIWESTTGTEMIRIHHDKLVSSVAFSPNSKYVVSSSGYDVVRVWLWQPKDLTEAACQRVIRNLTRAEWEQYIPDEPFPTKQEDAICPHYPLEPASVPTATP